MQVSLQAVRLAASASALPAGLATEPGPRGSAQGIGFRETVVGSGADNTFDVLDRRVEFKVVCR